MKMTVKINNHPTAHAWKWVVKSSLDPALWPFLKKSPESTLTSEGGKKKNFDHRPLASENLHSFIYVSWNNSKMGKCLISVEFVHWEDHGSGQLEACLKLSCGVSKFINPANYQKEYLVIDFWKIANVRLWGDSVLSLATKILRYMSNMRK